MYTRQNARQIRERHYYNGVTTAMMEIRELLKSGEFNVGEGSQRKHMTFNSKIVDRVKEVRAAHDKGFNPLDHAQNK